MHILKRSYSNDNVPAILWDYDDTLGGIKLPTGEIRPGAAAYDDVIHRQQRFFQTYYGSHAATKIIALQAEIDMILAKKYGFNDKTRFANSFVEAYKAYCEDVKAKCYENRCEEAFRIGMSVFTDYPYCPMEHAAEVFERTGRRFKNVIITKGAVDEQERKLRHTGFYEAADDIYIVGKKDLNDWVSVLKDLNHIASDKLDSDFPLISESWAIGNSAKADVNLLVEAGYNGLHITEKNGWAFEQAVLATPRTGRICKAIADISEVLDIIPELQEGR